jgi:hypothetical protein
MAKRELMYKGDIPKADHFQIFACGDPKCGPHIIAFNAEGHPILDIVIANEYVPEVCNEMLNILDASE